MRLRHTPARTILVAAAMVGLLAIASLATRGDGSTTAPPGSGIANTIGQHLVVVGALVLAPIVLVVGGALFIYAQVFRRRANPMLLEKLGKSRRGGLVGLMIVARLVIYHLRTGRLRRGERRILWTTRPTLPPNGGQLVRWWEGNVAVGPGGNLYAGNTGGTAYAITPGGRRVWTFTGGNSIWTTPAFAADGSSYWGSLDFHIYHLNPRGRPLWQTFTPGYVVSSPAIGSDGTVYVGSFDSKPPRRAATGGG